MRKNILALDKIMELLGVSTDKELSEALGHSAPSTVGSWRSRGKVPQKVIREWALTYGKPYAWFCGLDVQKAEPDDEIETALLGMMHGLSKEKRQRYLWQQLKLFSPTISQKNNHAGHCG